MIAINIFWLTYSEFFVRCSVEKPKFRVSQLAKASAAMFSN
jgi:hypothetical protein